MKNKLLLFLLILFPFSAVSGTKVGNGGFVIKCEQDNKASYVFYDLFKFYKANSDWKPAFDADAAEEYLIADKVLQNYSKLDKDSADWLSFNISLTKKNTIDYSGQASSFETQIQDDFTLPSHCKKIQAVSNTRAISPNILIGISPYVVKPDLFLPLDNLNKAALRIHEALYAEDSILIENVINTESSIAYTQFLFSLPDLAKVNWHDLLKWQIVNIQVRAKNNFKFSHYAGYSVLVNPPPLVCPMTWHQNGLIKNILLKRFERKTSENRHEVLINGCAEFNEHGELRTVNKVIGTQKLRCRKLNLNPNQIHYICN